MAIVVCKATNGGMGEVLADGGDLRRRLTWPTLLVAATSAIAVSLAFGTYLALCAARLSPIDAARHE